MRKVIDGLLPEGSFCQELIDVGHSLVTNKKEKIHIPSPARKLELA